MRIQLPESINDSISHQELTKKRLKVEKQMGCNTSWKMLRQFIKYPRWIHISLNLSMSVI